MFSKKLFGQRLREARRKSGETQTDLGQLLNIQKSQVSELENGSASTTLEKTAAICEHYKISSDYLLGLSDDPAPRGKAETEI